MRQAVRALGWTINIAMILLAIFLGTSMYSMFSTLMGRGIGFGGGQPYASNGVLVLPTLFFVNNTGYYDISEVNLTTYVRDYGGTLISRSMTLVELVARGNMVEGVHNVSLSWTDVVSKNLTYLTRDSELRMDMSIGFRYAYAFSFQLTIPNMSRMPWGAPLYNLSVGEVFYHFNGTHHLLDIPFGFENHSFINATGIIQFEVYNSQGEYLGSEAMHVNALPGSRYKDRIKVVISEETVTGYVHIYFETFGPVVKTFG